MITKGKISVTAMVFTILGGLSLCSCTSGSNKNSEADTPFYYEEDENDNILDSFSLISEFTKNTRLKGIYSYESGYYIVTNDEKVVPAEKYKYLSFPDGWVEPWCEDESKILEEDCYIAFVDDQVMVYDSKGREMIENGVKEYKLYPYGSFVYGKSNKGWNLYDLQKIQSDKNDPRPYYSIYFKNCNVDRDGALLEGKDGKLYLSRTDEGEMGIFEADGRDLSGSEELSEEEIQKRNQLLLLLFFQNMMISQAQVNQVNSVYSSLGSSSRSRADIQRDIDKCNREIQFCESHMNDGIADGIGYGRISSNYQRMKSEFEYELQFSR